MAGFVPHSETLLWLEIRDTLLGENYVTQDMEKAVRLASMCNHPDARWLVSVCAGKEISTREKALQVFQAE
jgi:hypothetical protein